MTISQTLLSNTEAAALLGITPNTLKFWRHKGRGPAFVKYGESARSGVGYDPADVAAWIAERKFASTSAYSPAARANAKPNVRRSADVSA
ncbi:helix-turn-helix transcriptional regulator [Croceibacterium ferulae]|uniref:helix-turn-helix transcriptional regulator n=1 Tax=Croceibacterium ferulae TaxID=1854641 RepID=UPI000EB4FCA6|nr:helix-turn-helix domain-containing protein [Croceibacterium ferulae]